MRTRRYWLRLWSDRYKTYVATSHWQDASVPLNEVIKIWDMLYPNTWYRIDLEPLDGQNYYEFVYESNTKPHQVSFFQSL